MDKIVEEVKEIEKRRWEEFILNMIMGFLFFIFFIGFIGGGFIVMSVCGLLMFIGVVGEVGVVVYSVVKDLDNVFIIVVGMLLGMGFSCGGFWGVVNMRWGMSLMEYNSFGNIKFKFDIIGNFWGGMCVL